MKTYKHLYDSITSFDNLLLAAKNACKGKRYQPKVSRFHLFLEQELFGLQRELREKSYRPGPYKTFTIHDPKERLISAAPYRDRVVHHALCNLIEPLFDRTFVHDTYANRKGKGTHRAILRYQEFARRYAYVLKCDIRKFFPSLDHAILKEEIRWKIACPDTLWLIDLIIDHSNPQEPHAVYFPGDHLFTPVSRPKGLPIGNLTSQIWGNVYLNRFDHFVKEELRVKGYIRYVDDFVLFSDSKEELKAWRAAITHRLAHLRLIPHPNKTHIHRVGRGVPFLGFRVFPQYKYVLKEKSKRHSRYVRKLLESYLAGQCTPEHLEGSFNSWLGHVRFGASARLEYRHYWYIRGRGVDLFRHPCGSWRFLEQ